MRKILWIGSYLNEEIFEEYQRYGYKNAASYISQRNIVQGIERIINQKIDSLNLISMKGYPFDKKLLIGEKSFYAGSKNVIAGFVNILYLNKIIGNISLERLSKNWIRENKVYISDGLDIFIYEMRSACLNAAHLIKKEIPNTKIHLIVPDLPIFMDLKMSFIKRFLKKLDWVNIKRQLICVDDYILYAAPMAEFLQIKHRPWLLMEGSININDADIISEQINDPQKFIVMYSGAIDKQYGIEELINAFKYLDDKFELWLTGGGKFENEVRKVSMKDKRIKYYGFLPNRKELLALQQRASVLINMRNPSEKASNYCFPSKLFEYMLMGKPVISCKLGGIPKEYYRYLIILKTIKALDIAETIKKVAAMSKNDRSHFGKKAQNFIIENKNNNVQAKRILNFINLITE